MTNILKRGNFLTEWEKEERKDTVYEVVDEGNQRPVRHIFGLWNEFRA